MVKMGNGCFRKARFLKAYLVLTSRKFNFLNVGLIKQTEI